MGCCCSSCCCCKKCQDEHVEQSLEYTLSDRPNDRPKTPAEDDIHQHDLDTITDDQPPPYEADQAPRHDAPVDTALIPEVTTFERTPVDLPFVVPLTSNGTGFEAEDSLAAAYVDDFESFRISKQKYLAFLEGLDTGLFASPSAEPGSVSAYIHSMFSDSASSAGDVTWQANVSEDLVERSKAYVSVANGQLFHQAGIQVRVLNTEDMKREIDAVSEAQLSSRDARTQEKRNREALKLEQRLLTSKTLERQQRAIRKFLEKDARYSRQSAGSKAAAPIAAPSSAADGVYWLLVTKYER